LQNGLNKKNGAKTMTKTKIVHGIVLAHNIGTTKEGKKRYGIQIKEKEGETLWINGFGELPAFIEEGTTIEATVTDDKWKNITSIEKAPETHTKTRQHSRNQARMCKSHRNCHERRTHRQDRHGIVHGCNEATL